MSRSISPILALIVLLFLSRELFMAPNDIASPVTQKIALEYLSAVTRGMSSVPCRNLQLQNYSLTVRFRRLIFSFPS
ncbi:hypothetical protein BKA61DRAFT_605691 [Leptodontidium sp. MPI-SDFR-AT-0119]|nr:hypothetical protein BKA61DRAFT_605691 [Leptodontidium sp. MPI-SDFR-AT-0119]